MKKTPLKPFLILSLPRSRTAWLANYFWANGVKCYHELTLNVHIDKMLSRLDGKHGNSDSGLLLYPDHLGEWIGKNTVRALFVKRDITDVIPTYFASLKREEVSYDREQMMSVLDHVNVVLDQLISTFGKNKNCMTVKFEDINQALPDIHRFCTPQIEFCPERACELNFLSVTQRMKTRLDYGRLS